MIFNIFKLSICDDHIIVESEVENFDFDRRFSFSIIECFERKKNDFYTLENVLGEQVWRILFWLMGF